MSFPRRRGNLLTRKTEKNKTSITGKFFGNYYINWIYPTLIISVMVICLVLYLGLSAQLVTTQYSICQLKTEKVKLLEEQRAVNMNIEFLESLSRVEAIAVKDLKMVVPKERLVLNLDKSTTTAFNSGE
jgi:cell division protein FtsL